MWTRLQQQQQRGAQMEGRASRARQPGEAPDEATRDRAAQEHDRAGQSAAQPGGYPASPIEHRTGDNTPSAPGDPRVEWDDVVQPERRRTRQAGERDERPGPEGQ